ncbi:MAG: hypothetical protein QY325_04360 [Flavobacteriales bacterium]|nr:MAG: hypothetical protein QY325_04360 [Flavobacteriales bacterium]
MNTSNALDAVMHRLRTDAYYATEVITRNNPDGVLQRYVALTGAAAPPNTEALLGKLNSLRAGGRSNLVRDILWGVNWRYGVSSPTLDEVFRSWQGEVASRLNDPAATAKNLPTTGNGVFDPTGGAGWGSGTSDGTVYGPENQAGGSASGGGNALSWAEAITAGMGSLAGLLHVINGGQLPSPGGTGNQAPPPQPATNWGKVILIGLVVVGVIVGIAYAVKALKK